MNMAVKPDAAASIGHMKRSSKGGVAERLLGAAPTTAPDGVGHARIAGERRGWSTPALPAPAKGPIVGHSRAFRHFQKRPFIHLGTSGSETSKARVECMDREGTVEQLGSPATAQYGHRANGTNVDRPMTRGIVIGRAAFVLGAWLLLGASTEAPDFSAAARAMDATIEREYAYSEKLPGGAPPRSAHLDAERAAVHEIGRAHV